MNSNTINKQFWQYVLPSMFAMLLSGFYAMIDGLFVGNAIGDIALGAINLAYPIQTVLNASAMGLGIGGAVVMSCCRGNKEEAKARHAMGSTLLLLLLTGLGLSFLLWSAHPMLLHMLGAQGELYDLAESYTVVILLGGIFLMLGNGVNPLIRNYGKTYLATCIMSSGLLTNIVLDYVFIIRMNFGLIGAAWATILAQAMVAILSLVYLYIQELRFYTRKELTLRLSLIKNILRIGISPFGQTMAPSLVIVLTNWMCLYYGGNAAITMYSVVSYVLWSVQLLLQGIGDGVQPLLSFYHGANKKEVIQLLYHKAFYLAVLVSLLLCVAVVLFLDPLISLFGVSEAIFASVKTAVLITALSFPFLGIVRVTCALFYATEETRKSTLLVYVEPCLLLPVCLLVLSYFFHLSGVWSAYPLAQLLLSILAMILHHKK